MIIIFSDEHDYSTTKVIEYLLYLEEEVIRIIPKDSLKIVYDITIANKRKKKIEIKINNKVLLLSNIKSIWFRRGGFYYEEIKKNQIIKDVEILHPQVNQYFSSEQMALNHFLYSTLINSKIKVLGNPFLYNTNKLSVLDKAIKFGLSVPYTVILTNKEDLYKLLSRKKEFITKAIQDNFTPVLSDDGYGLLTQIVDKDILSNLPSSFFPSLFQEKLNKKYDIRIFYLDGLFYSISIHSQQNSKTCIDFRNYDHGNPNRKNILNLPDTIKDKLKALLKAFKLNTASIDMVYTEENKYVFLEINPVGQYDMVGKLMNFNLDKKIASWLTKN